MGTLSKHPAHQCRFHFLIPSSLQTRHRLSLDLSCSNSSNNCLCCVLGEAGVQSKYFQKEKDFSTTRRSARVIWSLKKLFLLFFFFFFSRGWKKVLIKLKACLRSEKWDISPLYPHFTQRRGKKGSKEGRLRDWFYLRRQCSLLSQIAWLYI